MQFLQSRIILLHKIPFKDFKYYLKVLSENYGLLSVQVELNNYLPPAYIQIPTLADALMIQNKFGITIHDLKPYHIYQNIHQNFKKNTLAQFFIEVLIKTSKEQLSDQSFFNYLYDTLLNINNTTESALPEILILSLKKYISLSGIMPLNNFSEHSPYFNTQEGKFVSYYKQGHTLSFEDSQLFHELLFNNELPPNKFPFKWLHFMLDYIKYHLDAYHFNSLILLKDVMSDLQT